MGMPPRIAFGGLKIAYREKQIIKSDIYITKHIISKRRINITTHFKFLDKNRNCLHIITFFTW